MEIIKDCLEFLYFLSGPAIAVIAYLALSQIKVAKEQMEEQKRSLRVSSKRDALKLTSEQVTVYADKIIPLQSALKIKLKGEEINFLDKFEIEFEGDSIKVIPPKEDFDLQELIKAGSEFVSVANAMESFSTYFASGVADEKIAYLSLGSTFCDSMQMMAPILIPLSNDGRRFSATLRLYYIWGSRLEAETLEKQKRDIEKKLSSKKQTSVKVVGTNA
ncbi:hypothetical protein [Shewanella salipaludis]|uniref:Uncharacterized protein n=1 Tax=Shewanella salipaludis TaxID=2723052 RepID=A0A972FZQ3_9GAMM|nr:hypothetical protein [Shewanella salipaludis]NMH65657.1 hypothetical protein [Shewanella salipaludis]